ncbi:hypothetical protein FI667_g468, partial [Globisporangium splendens]
MGHLSERPRERGAPKQVDPFDRAERASTDARLAQQERVKTSAAPSGSRCEPWDPLLQNANLEPRRHTKGTSSSWEEIVWVVLQSTVPFLPSILPLSRRPSLPAPEANLRAGRRINSESALATTTTAPVIEPSNTPISAQTTASYMNKSADDGASAAGASTPDGSGTSTPALRILKKTMSTESVLGDDKSNTGQSSSGGGTPNAARQRKYERKTKRFIWPDELHRLFVAAIFDGNDQGHSSFAILVGTAGITNASMCFNVVCSVGLKNASPKALLGLMGVAGPESGLTTEHLKSHLQKYRLNYERSRAEFLEFYDHSAKKNLKRRRKHGNKAGESNTMFVFPIAPKKQKGDDDSDDSDNSNNENDDDAADESMSDAHTTPRSSITSSERTGSYSSLLQEAKESQQKASGYHASRNQHPQHIQNRLLESSSAGDRVSYSAMNTSGAMSNQALQVAAYAASQRKASMSGSNANGLNNRAIAAAAAAAFRYPMGLPMGPGNPTGVLGDLSDPQWNILSSLMSPHITGMNGSAGGVVPTSEGMGDEQFQLNHDEPNDLQLQMHLAMQAQMNLHRQMLTRKVEVSQHLINNQHDGNTNSSMYGQQWGGQQQQQQYYQPDQRAVAAARQALVNSSHHPQMQMNQMNANAMSQQNPRPSLPPRNPANTANAALTVSMGMGNTQMSSSSVNSQQNNSGKAPIPTAVGPPVDVNMLLSETTSGSDAPTLGANLGFDNPPTAAATADDDSLDLYRWDRIDLNVELDDDDLFGFLKS